MKSASLATSRRLQRLYALLKSGQEYTTLEIIQQANIAAVSAAVSELRDNIRKFGKDVICRKLDRGRYCYRLTSL